MVDELEVTTKANQADYYYDGAHVYMETDGNGTIVGRNFFSGSPLYRENRDRQYAFFVTDGHGDVRGLSGPDGQKLDATYDYDAFGNPTGGTGVWSNPFRYAGEPWDEEAGLYYLRARYYRPGSGRFVTEDAYRGARLLKTGTLTLARTGVD